MLMTIKLNVLYQISLPQDPKNHWLLTRMSFNNMKKCLSEMYQLESDEPVDQEQGWVLDFFFTLYLEPSIASAKVAPCLLK